MPLIWKIYQLPIRFTLSGSAQALPLPVYEARATSFRKRNFFLLRNTRGKWIKAKEPVRRVRGEHVQAHQSHTSCCHDDNDDDGRRKGEVGKRNNGT